MLSADAQAFTSAMLMLLVATAAAVQAYDASVMQLPTLRSALPLLVLASRGPLPNEPKGPANLLVSACGPLATANGNDSDNHGGKNDSVSTSGPVGCCLGCGIPPQLVSPVGAELRGRSSQAADKKSYAIELRHPNGSSNPRPLLGLPPASEWVLHGLALDRSLLRDALASELARGQGRWAPHWVFVELFVVEDGADKLGIPEHYKGVYAVVEPVERGQQRVNVQPLVAPDPTGGYILELSNAAAAEWWAAQLREQLPPAIIRLGPTRVDFKYPKPSRAPAAAWRYVAALMANVSLALSSTPTASSAPAGPGPDAPPLHSLLDLPALVDLLLHTELGCDYDGYVSSVYLYKDRGGPLVAGPVWDKNLAYGNELEVTSPSGCGWRYAAPAVQNSGQAAVWMGALARAQWWRRDVAARWRQLREGAGPWSDAALRNLMDRLRSSLPAASVRRNFERWPLARISSNQRFVTLPPSLGSWEAEVNALGSWLLARALWLDEVLLRGEEVDGSPVMPAPPPPNIITNVAGAVLSGRPVARAFREGTGLALAAGG